MPVRSDGDSTAVWLPAVRCRLDGCGDTNTGDGERKSGERKPGEPIECMSENGDNGEIARSGDTTDARGPAGEATAEAAPGTATKGETARDSAGEPPSSVGLRATSNRSEPSLRGVPYPALGARLEGPTTAGANELAVESERVEPAGLCTRGDITGTDAGGLGSVDSAVTADCSLEVLMTVLGEGLCITGGVEVWTVPNLGAKGDEGAEVSVADRGIGDIGS